MFTTPRPLSRVHAPCWAALMGAGAEEYGNLATTSAPAPLSITALRELLREAQEGRQRATCVRISPGNWDSLPILSGGQGICTAAAEGTLPGPPPGFPRRPWVQVPLNSDFPI